MVLYTPAQVRMHMCMFENLAILARIMVTRPLHVDDTGALYHAGPIRPMRGHDPRVTRLACPAC
jgi:hypothetical protein